jgi:hypothetical protein
MEHHTVNPMQPTNLASAPRCGAKTRSGVTCRAPAVRGRLRCRMHGGTNKGAPQGNNNARKHGNRSAEAEEQLKIVRQTNQHLRVLSKVRQGLELNIRERDRLVQIYAESRRANRLPDASDLEPKKVD